MAFALASRVVTESLAEAFRPAEHASLEAWGEANRVLVAEGVGAELTGRLRFSVTPYLREVARAIDDPMVREVAVQKSAQSGFTELGMTWVMREAARAQTVCVVYPTDKKGRDINEQRLVPAIRACAALSGRLQDRGKPILADRVRLSSGGGIIFAYTKTRTSLKSTPIPKLLGDEIDDFEAGALERMRSRTTTFPDSTIVKGSTPEHAADAEFGVEYEYESADVRCQYHVPCPACGAFFECFSFELLRWEGGRRADPEAAAVTTRLRAPCCGAMVDESRKGWMVANGLWVRQHERVESDGTICSLPGAELSALGGDAFREYSGPAGRLLRSAADDAARAESQARYGVRIVCEEGHATPTGERWGFRFNNLISLIAAEGWRGLVRGFVRARGKPEATFWKEKLAQPPRDKGEGVEITRLRLLSRGTDEGGYRCGVVPEGFNGLLFPTYDVQKAGLYLATWGFGPGMTRPTLVDAAFIPRDYSLRLEDVFETCRDRVYADARGAPHRPYVQAFDARWDTDAVYGLCRRLQGAGVNAVPVMGASVTDSHFQPYRWIAGDEKRDPVTKQRVKRDHAVRTLLVNHSHMAGVLARALRGDPGAIGAAPDAEVAGAIAASADGVARLPADEPSWPGAGEFFEQMTAEHEVSKVVAGRVRRVWVPKREGIANHYFDASVDAFAVADAVGMRLITAEAIAARSARLGSASGTPGSPDSTAAAATRNTPAADARTRTRAGGTNTAALEALRDRYTR